MTWVTYREKWSQVEVKKVGEAKQLVFEGSVAVEGHEPPVGAGAEAGAQ